MVFLVGGRGNAVHAGRMSQYFILRYQGSSTILHDHITGIQSAALYQECGKSVVEGRIYKTLNTAFCHICKFSDSDTEEIKGESHGLSVEVSAGNDLLGLREDDRVVCYRVHFHFYLVNNVIWGRQRRVYGSCTRSSPCSVVI